MKTFIKTKQKYKNLNKVEIDKNNLISNYNYYRKLYKGINIAPVLKSNAYGHGILEIAKILDPLKPPFIIVDSLYEAYKLQSVKIKTPILITGYTIKDNFKFKSISNIKLAIYDIDTLDYVYKNQKNISMHIFIDTGMHREGIQLQDIPNFISKISKYKNLKIESIMSHLSDGNDTNFSKLQIKNFKLAIDLFENVGYEFKFKHITATYGFINKNLDFKFCNVARIGLGLYTPPNLKIKKYIKPVLSLKGTLVQIKNINFNEYIGYDKTFKVTRLKGMKIGIVSVGYFDGIDINLSNKGFMLYKGKFCKIIGRVSMNIATIDLSDIKNPTIEDEILIYSSNHKDKNSIYNTSKIIGQNQYIILTHIQSLTKRVIV